MSKIVHRVFPNLHIKSYVIFVLLAVMTTILNSPRLLANELATDTVISSSEPRVRHEFNRAVVQQMLTNIETGYNAQILKVAYFATRKPQVFPVEEGYELLLTAIKHEKIASRRWFTLQEIHAFSALRLYSDTQDEGLKIYSEIFANSDLAKATGSANIVQSTVYDFIVTVPTQRFPKSASQRVFARKIFIEAMKTFLLFDKANESIKPKLDWEPAVKDLFDTSSDYRDLNGVLKVVVNDVFVSKSPDSLYTIAQIQRAFDPRSSEILLLNAIKLLPKDSKKRSEFYNELSKALMAQKKVKEAVDIQKQEWRSMGRGLPQLITLQLQTNDIEGVCSTLSVIDVQNVDEKEILRVAQTLFFGLDEKDVGQQDRIRLQKQGIQILRQYLASTRAENTRYALEARLLLAQIFVEQKNIAEAKTMLAFVEPKIVQGTDEQLLFKSIKQTLESVEKS